MQIVWNYGATAQLHQDYGACVFNWSGSAGAETITPGGAFRRALPTWGRTLSRALPTWQRTWSYRPMALLTEGAALFAAESDDREYAFDCQHAPELAVGTGITISSGVIVGGSGLTVGSVSVLTAAFDDIPADKGLKVRISGGSAGTTYKLACKATLSNSRVIVVPGRLVKTRDYDA